MYTYYIYILYVTQYGVNIQNRLRREKEALKKKKEKKKKERL